ncbi:MAG: hypothetical protein MJY93_04930 [Fibrobacter sp.]|nr:hypothetical protein [Fibrobacter sp.]
MIPLVVAFAIFPLTDTDIWWHLACAREWVTTWTPVREPVVNVHEYFQQIVAFVFGLGGAPLLVAFKALLWGAVFALFLHGSLKKWISVVVAAILIFVFRYQLEMRPVVLSLLFLGIYWNVIPWLAMGYDDKKKQWAAAIGILCLQWIWCKCQGLYILGPIFALATIVVYFDRNNFDRLALLALFVLALFGMPFLHRDGLLLAVYPFELLNRLVGLSDSATIFAKEIAENRSPITLLLEGENFWTSLLMIACAVAGLGYAIKQFVGMVRSKALRNEEGLLKSVVLCTTAILALLAERNFVLFLPVFLYFVGRLEIPGSSKVVIPGFDPAATHLGIYSLVRLVPVGGGSPVPKYIVTIVLMFVLGLWGKSMQVYEKNLISSQRVPVGAAAWMKENPHEGRLFNDDRAGGFLALTNPADSIYIDGRFMLKTAEFFEQYLRFAKEPAQFLSYAEAEHIDRAIFPLKYYARWGKLIQALSNDSEWNLAYKDEYFCVFQKKSSL